MAERPPGLVPVDTDSIERGYESRDVRTRPLLWLFVGVVVLFGGLAGGLWWFYRVETSRRSPADGPLSVARPTGLPDAPPLQPQVGHESLDAWDLQAMRQQENATFAALGWQQDAKTKRFTVPAGVIETLQSRQAASRPSGGGR